METTGKEKNTVTKAFAVIDTETNFNDHVMSIGMVIADADKFQPISKKYYIISPECSRGGMYTSALFLRNTNPIKCTRKQAIDDIICSLKQYSIMKLYAYNASFDQNHLPELADYYWHDIIQFAAYKQYNLKIPRDAECYGTGRLKRNYGVESIMRLLSGNRGYFETHNAILDALDELKIMELLAYPPDQYKSSKSTGKESAAYHRGTSVKATLKHDFVQEKKVERTIDISCERKAACGINHDTFQKDTKENTMENSDRVKKLSVEKSDTIQNQSEIISPEILNEEKETYESEKKSKSILEKFFSLVKEFFQNL